MYPRFIQHQLPASPIEPVATETIKRSDETPQENAW